MEILHALETSLNIPAKNIQAVLDLLEEGATIPFIARYRKERTGSLDEDQILQIQTQYQAKKNLEARKEDVIRLIEEKNLMNDTLRASILQATKLSELEELYRPYKEKKLTKATAAIEAGLAPLTDVLKSAKSDKQWKDVLDLWKRKTKLSEEELLEQCGYILAQQLSDDAKIRAKVKEEAEKNGIISAKLKKGAEDPAGTYELYYDFSAKVRQIKNHQILALHRAEKEKILTVSITFDPEWIYTWIEREQKFYPNKPGYEWKKACVQDACKRLIFPSIIRAVRKDLEARAEENAIETFSSNLLHLLMQRPLGACRVLGFDPAFRTGCKLAVLDEHSNVLAIDVIYPHQPQNKVEESAKKIKQLIDTYNIEYIAIGNGTASRESEAFIANVIKDRPQTKYALVSEAGASVYSASELAREEFPDLTVEKRSAISIGRRIQDPLSELVKIDPKSIGVGEYQHDVNQKQLSQALDFVTSKAVNSVGVNINTASPSLLAHVSGLTKTHIKKLIEARKISPFKTRHDVQNVKGISDKTYEQCIGFLRVPESKNVLDHTGIHPESYFLTRELMNSLKLDLKDYREDSFREVLQNANLDKLATELKTDHYTLEDIVKELLHPGLDPRDSLEGPTLRQNVLTIKDLKEGMELQGTIRNVTSFGAFVDIGLHNDGLIHISKLSRKFVKNPLDVVHTGQVVTCTVCGIDPKRERVQLSLI